MKLPSAADLRFSLASFAAAILAFVVSVELSLPRPSWAVLTVYVVSQPLIGALRSKGIYRAIGTVLGAVVAVVLVPPLSSAPELLALVFALWGGVCLYVSLLDRTPRSYVFMLAGYTAAIVGFPSVVHPELVFDNALGRVEEITLGIACATVVHTVFFPRSVAAAVRERVGRFLEDAARLAGDILADPELARVRRDRTRLATDIAELRTLIAHVPFDVTARSASVGLLEALLHHLGRLLPLLEAVEEWRGSPELAHLSRERPDWRARLAETSAWLATAGAERDPAVARELARAWDDASRLPARTGVPSWADLAAAAHGARISELVEVLAQCDRLQRALLHPGPPVDLDVDDPASPGDARRAFHVDHALAARSGGALALALLAVCAVWLGTGWSDGANAALTTAIFGSLYANLDDPTPSMRVSLLVNAVALGLAGVYVFVVFPAIDGLPLLALALAPPLLVVAAIPVRATGAVHVVVFELIFVGALGLEERQRADFVGYVNASLAQLVGIGAATVCASFVSAVGAEQVARRVLRAVREETAALVSSLTVPTRAAYLRRMLDRVALLAPRLAQLDDVDEATTRAPMRALCLGLNVLDVRACRDALPPEAARAVERALTALGTRLRDEVAQLARPVDDLRAAIDDAIVATARAAASGSVPSREVHRGEVALVGLRRNLLPGEGPLASLASEVVS